MSSHEEQNAPTDRFRRLYPTQPKKAGEAPPAPVVLTPEEKARTWIGHLDGETDPDHESEAWF